MDLHGSATHLDDGDLSEDDDQPHDDEHGVGEESVEDIQLVVDLPGAQHVENLEEHEHVEHQSQVAGMSELVEGLVDGVSIQPPDHAVEDQVPVPISVLLHWVVVEVLGDDGGVRVLRDESLGTKDNDEHDHGLEEGLSENVLGHLLRDDVLLLSIRGSLKELLSWQLSSQSKGSQRIHDKVDPQELDGLKRRLPHDDRSNESSNESHNIYSELELKESSDVVINIPSPHAGLHN